MQDLKPCPFCGSPAIRVSHPGHNWDGQAGQYVNIGACYGTWYVGCPAPFFESIVPFCETAPAAKWYAELEGAEREWNKRG